MSTPDENPMSEPINEASPVVPAQPAPAATPYAAPTAPPDAYVAPNPYPKTWMNITAFVTGLLGLAIIPIVFGHLGVSASNKGKAELKWMGIVGLVLGYLTVVAYLIITAVVIGAIIANNN